MRRKSWRKAISTTELSLDAASQRDITQFVADLAGKIYGDALCMVRVADLR